MVLPRRASVLAMGVLVTLALRAGAYTPETVRAAMRPMILDSAVTYPQPVLDYFAYYGLDIPGVTHWFGSYPSDTFTLAAHVFRPAAPRGTLLVVHGYYDHAGIMRTIIRAGVDAGYAVAAIDLPGHGLSSGTRASIDDFAQYGRAIEDLLSRYAASLPRPVILAGHSTGCAAIVEYLHVTGEGQIDRAILCAPLVHGALWDLSRFGHWVAGSWLKTTFRWFRISSSDRAWLDWYRHEPLQETSFPAQWATAMYAWNSRLTGYAPLGLPVTVIQGTRDETVDWKYNIPALRKLCTHLTVRLIDKGRHQLPNEAAAVQMEFLRLLGEELR